MTNKIKNISLVAILVFVSVYFTGCIDLSKKSAAPVTVATANDHQGIFKSTDGGATWQHKVKIQDSEKQLDGIKTASLKLDPNDRNVIYVGTIGNGLYRSVDGADTWKQVADKNNILTPTATVYSIDIEKGNSNIIYLAALNGGRGALLKSEDGGESWEEAYIISQAGKQVNFVQIDPASKNIVYIGTEQGGFLKSEDRGKRWLSLNWFSTGVRDFVVDYNNTKGIIARTANEIQKTKDGGETWDLLNTLMVKSLSLKINIAQISSMKIDNQNPFKVYITYLNLILLTEDGGETWSIMNTITPARTAVGTIPQVKQIGITDSTIYYGAGNALYKSSNKGSTWSSYDIPILGDVRYTASDYTDMKIIYLAAFYDPPKKR